MVIMFVLAGAARSLVPMIRLATLFQICEGFAAGQELPSEDEPLRCAQGVAYRKLCLKNLLPPCSAATSCVGATLTILLATASVIDADHRLRPERLTKQMRGQKLEHRIQAFLYQVRWRMSSHQAIGRP